jgi:hypothetical protein
MKKQIENLKKVVELGKKATQGVIGTDQGGEVTESDGTCILAKPQYNPCPNFINDALFTSMAFGSRKDLEDLIAYTENLERVLMECLDYFDGMADADCDQDGYVPNKEMQMKTEIEQTLTGKE